MKQQWEAAFTFLPFKQCGGIFKVTYEKDSSDGKVTVHAIKRNVSYGRNLDDSVMVENHNLNYSSVRGPMSQHESNHNLDSPKLTQKESQFMSS